ncbi:MAG: hypothetical protein EXQ99_02555 [Alphaproteobacteria bacterium]|nr:hypothetical protein [Alphaproteobacteria bacterium]
MDVVALGERWTTRIIVLPGKSLVRRGPYRFMRHPNYLIVALELAVLRCRLKHGRSRWSLAHSTSRCWPIVSVSRTPPCEPFKARRRKQRCHPRCVPVPPKDESAAPRHEPHPRGGRLGTANARAIMSQQHLGGIECLKALRRAGIAVLMEAAVHTRADQPVIVIRPQIKVTWRRLGEALSMPRSVSRSAIPRRARSLACSSSQFTKANWKAPTRLPPSTRVI